MSADIPLFVEVRRLAIKERREITCVVMMHDDSVRLVSFGPRGGWAFRKK